MSNFTISAALFNQLQKRLITLTGSDKQAIVSIVPTQLGIKVYYNSKIDKGEISSLFYEEIPIICSEIPENFNKVISLLGSNFFSIRVPEVVSEEKYPQCREVKFSFTDSILTLEFSVAWNRHDVGNVTKLHFPLLDSSEELDSYALLFNTNINKFKLNGQTLIEAIQQSSFIKSDVTSKESNGCLVELKDNQISMVSTDSNIAVRYKNSILESEDEDLKASFVASMPILSSIKSFISDKEDIEIGVNKKFIFISMLNRSMVAPIMHNNYIIQDSDSFFSLDFKYIGLIDLKPTITCISNLVANSNDLYKKIVLEFSNKLDIKTDKDKTKNIPCKISEQASISVNGEFFYSSCQRLVTLDLFAKLYFDEDTGKIGLVTDSDDKLIFLIQGLSN